MSKECSAIWHKLFLTKVAFLWLSTSLGPWSMCNIRHWKWGDFFGKDFVQPRMHIHIVNMAVSTPSKPYTHIQKKRKKNHLIIILLDNYIGPQTIKPFCVCSFAHILLVSTVAPGSRKARQSTSAHDRFWQFSSFRNSFKHRFFILCPSGFVVRFRNSKVPRHFRNSFGFLISQLSID